MTKTDSKSEIEEVEALLDNLDPSETPAKDATVVAQISALVDARSTIDSDLIDAIARARREEISWGFIANALGVSRQAARQKYDPLVSPRA